MSPNDLNVKETLVQIDLLLHNAARRRFVRIADCDDLRQDVFIAVFTGVERYDAKRSSWPTFMATIIPSEIHRFRLKKRWLKHQACESIHDLDEEEHPLTNNYPTSELNDIERIVFHGEIRQAVTKLPHDLQVICRMLFTSSKAKTADLLGMEPQFLDYKISQIRKLFFVSKFTRDGL
jgi:RNA polymerase sigma factor (sigma-70 family)